MAPKITFRLVQMAPRLGDAAYNLDRHLEHARAARADGVDVVVFPELSLTGYYLRDLVSEVAENTDGPTVRALADTAGDTMVVFGFIERDEHGRLFSAAAALHGGRVVHVHRKVYLPTYGMFDEGRYLTPGETIRSFQSDGWRGGLAICEDAWHVSVPFLLARDGAHVLIVISASPARGLTTTGRLASQIAWEDMLATYARQLQVFVVFCNRVGWEDGVGFWGGSGVWGTDGTQLARAPRFEETVLDCTIDLRDLMQIRGAVPLTADESDAITFRELGRIIRERTGD